MKSKFTNIISLLIILCMCFNSFAIELELADTKKEEITLDPNYRKHLTTKILDLNIPITQTDIIETIRQEQGKENTPIFLVKKTSQYAQALITSKLYDHYVDVGDYIWLVSCIISIDKPNGIRCIYYINEKGAKYTGFKTFTNEEILDIAIVRGNIVVGQSNKAGQYYFNDAEGTINGCLCNIPGLYLTKEKGLCLIGFRLDGRIGDIIPQS